MDLNSTPNTTAKEREIVSYKDIGEKREITTPMTVSKKKRIRTEKGKLKKKDLEEQIRMTVDFLQCSHANLDNRDLPECFVNLNTFDIFDGRQLQNLILWLLGDGLNPKMMMVRRKTQVKQLVIVYVPNLSPLDIMELDPTQKDQHFCLQSQYKPIKLSDEQSSDDRYVSFNFISDLSGFKSIFKTCVPFQIPVRRRCFEPVNEFLVRLSPSIKIKSSHHSFNMASMSEWAHKIESGKILRTDAIALYRVSQDAMNIHDYPKSIQNDPLFDTSVQNFENVKVQFHTHKHSNLRHFHMIPLLKDEIRVLAIDCEMVLTEYGDEAGRLSIVDESLDVIFDLIFKPSGKVLDYRTTYSGLSKDMIDSASKSLEDVQNSLIEIFNKFKGITYLVGHSLENDLKALRLTYDYNIDTALIYDGPNQGLKSSLKYLSKQFVGKTIQESSHDSTIDATCTMELFLLKMTKGPTFGQKRSVYEPLWQRINRANGRLAAVIDRPERIQKTGESAWKSITVHDDDEAALRATEKIRENKAFATWVSLDRLTCLSNKKNNKSEIFGAFQKNVMDIYAAMPKKAVILVVSGIGKIDKLFDSQKAAQTVLKKKDHSIIKDTNEMFDGFTYFNGKEMGSLTEDGVNEARLGAMLCSTKQ
eukprot:NODE_144_length_17694_cov_0.489741.p3 type:complete len:644 gc:universal NODE_144_length_17694_cov_0.489741:11455-9524(-)